LYYFGSNCANSLYHMVLRVKFWYFISDGQVRDGRATTAKEMAMSATDFDEFESEVEDATETTPVIEASPSTKLARRRKIEDLFEEKRLKEELADFG
jgi:hypothetical protein